MLRDGRLSRSSPFGHEVLQSRVTRDAEKALDRWLLLTIQAARTAVEEPSHIGPRDHTVYFQHSSAHSTSPRAPVGKLRWVTGEYQVAPCGIPNEHSACLTCRYYSGLCVPLPLASIAQWRPVPVLAKQESTTNSAVKVSDNIPRRIGIPCAFWCDTSAHEPIRFRGHVRLPNVG
jgi:hypothetical protein